MARSASRSVRGAPVWLDRLGVFAWLCVLAAVANAIVGVATARAETGSPGRDATAEVGAVGAIEASDPGATSDAPPAGIVADASPAPPSELPAALEPSIVPVEIERRVRQGGWVMAALFGCSLLVVALAVERLIATRRSLVWPAPLDALVGAPDGVDRDALRVQVKSGASVGERLVRAGLRAEENGAGDAAGIVAEIGLREVARLRIGLPLLATLANLATMLGLFGTVLGMIEAFELIAAQGTGDPRVVADGIFKALITTAAGLGIGITALAIHAALGARVNGRVRELEDGLGAIFDPAAMVPGAPRPARRERGAS